MSKLVCEVLYGHAPALAFYAAVAIWRSLAILRRLFAAHPVKQTLSSVFALGSPIAKCRLNAKTL